MYRPAKPAFSARRWALLPAALTLGLTLTACGATADEAEDDTDAADLVDHAVVTTYDGGIYVLDPDSLDLVADISLDGFLRVNPAGDDRHVLVSTAEGFRVLDAAAAELSDDEFEAPDPGHVVHHAGKTALFSDGSGEVTVFDPNDLGDGLPEAETHAAEHAHHGVAVTLDDGGLLISLGDEDERPGFQVLDAEGEETVRSEDCPGLHGEATAESETIAVGCEDGVAYYRDGEVVKVDSPDDYGRIGNQAGDESSPYLLGDYKKDPDAELERPEQVSVIDTVEGEMELVDLGASYSFRSLERGPHGEAFVLGTDGAIHVVDPESAEVVETFPVIEEWEEPLDWQEPRPAIFVDDHTAYVTEPSERKLYAVDTHSGETIAETELPESPDEITGVASH